MGVWRALVLVAAVCVAACAPPAPAPDEEEVEFKCPSDTPPPSDTCLEGLCGNELGVGRPCTKGGGQCGVFNLFAGEAGICIPDFADNTNVHCCSKPCSVDDDCGSGAVCFPDPITERLGCVPRGCEGR
jgi:hypothetical protein